MHPEDIRACLRKKFGSMAKFGQSLNCSKQAVPNAISRPGYSKRIEKEISKALGKSLSEVWPDRYDKNENPFSLNGRRVFK